MQTPVPITVLLVNGGTVDSELLAVALRDASEGPIKIRNAPNAEAACRMQEDRPSDVVLLVWDVKVNPTTLVPLMHAARPVPVVVLAATDDDEAALRWIRTGAQDFLVKNRASGDAIMRALHFAVERHRTLAAVEVLTCLDELTGLYNRRGVLTAGAQALQLARRRSAGLWALYADIDGLKTINDRHGHEAGDSALVEAAVALRASFRGSDVIGRYGGDEFVVLAIDAALESRELLLHRIARNLEKRNAGSRVAFALALSVGAARFEPEATTDLPELLGRADKALYEERERARGGGTAAPGLGDDPAG